MADTAESVVPKKIQNGYRLTDKHKMATAYISIVKISLEFVIRVNATIKMCQNCYIIN